MDGNNDMVSLTVNNNLFKLNRKVDGLLQENNQMISVVKNLIKEMDEFKKGCDAIKVVGLGASIFGSFLNMVSEWNEDPHPNSTGSGLVRESANIAEKVGTAANTGVKILDMWRTKVLINQITTLAEEYEQKRKHLSLQLRTFSTFSTETNRSTISIREGSSANDFSAIISIIQSGIVSGLANKANELLSLVENSDECHPAIPILQELIEKLELDSEKMVAIKEQISGSITDTRSSLRRDLVNCVEETDCDYSEATPSNSRTVRRFNYN